MYYASKALCNLAITKILDNEGFGFDVVSAGEIYTIKKAGVSMNKVLFNGNNKTAKELEYAIEVGVGRYSVDNFYEAELLNKLAEKQGKRVNILLRVTPGIDCHTHDYIQTGQIDSKFGFDLSQLNDIVSLVVNEYKNLNLVGLHAHVGSQIFELKCLEDEIKILLKELQKIKEKFGIELTELNLGGGFGVKYVDSDNPPSTDEVSNRIINTFRNILDDDSFSKMTVYLEPGRSIVSTSGVTLYTVGSSKQVPNGRKYVAVDGGMADNPRPSLYQAKYVAELCNDITGREIENVTLVGRYCESGDVIIEDINLPKLKPDDVLCIYNTGAYNYSMSSNYNRVEKPAMVLVNNSQSAIIVKRQTYEQLVQNDMLP